MKMGAFNRAVFIIGLVISLALWAFVAALAIGPGITVMEGFLGLLKQGHWFISVGLGVVSLLGILGTLKLAFMHPKREPKATGILLKSDELGTIRISTAALDTMAHKAISQVKQVREVKTRILDAGAGEAIIIQISVSFIADTNVPEVSDTLRKAVQTYVQSYSGVPVHSVQLFVDAYAQAGGHGGSVVS